MGASSETALPPGGPASAAGPASELEAVIDGRYRLVEQIGVGGMGTVYRAEHVGMGRVVAVKLLRPELGGKADAVERFTREAQASARVSHKNIVAVSDFGVRDDGTLYLVMEYLRGESLRERLDRRGRLPWMQAVGIARHVARGLAHAHAQGVVHRDIKPENIFLVEDDDDPEFAKILDFGIARSLEDDDARVTQAGFVVGTPAYLSPEQALGGAVDHRCDVYSLCIVLYEMLCGRTPFGDRPPVAMLTAHAVVEVPAMAEVAPDADVPPEVEALVRRGLAKERDQRQPDADTLTAELDLVRGHTDPGLALGRSSPGHVVPRVSTGLPVAYAATPPPGGLVTPPPGGPGALATPPPGGLAAVASPGAAPAPSGFGGWLVESFPRLRERAFVLRWLKLGVGGLVLVGVLVAIITSTNPDGASPRAPGAAPGSGVGSAVTPALPPRMPDLVPNPAISAASRDERLKAALHDLDKGKTCEERKAAVARLRDLGDARAVPALKRARYRMRGGVLGVGDSNTNRCLKADAEAALAELGAPP